MILHLVENNNTAVYMQTVPKLLLLEGRQRVYAAGLPSIGSFAVQQGNAVHARTSVGEAVSVVQLITCCAVFYCYMLDGQTTDVVAFHSPAGGLNLSRGERNGQFGNAKSEAAFYKINRYDEVKLIIAMGPDTANYGDPTREARVNKALRENPVFRLCDAFAENASFVYEHATYGIFGVNGLGHIGELGGTGIQRTPQPAHEPESTTKCRCYLSTAIMLALGKPDDCTELMMLRRFRDTYMALTPQRREEVAHYYRTAPALVARINNRLDSERIYEDIYRMHLVRALSALRAGQLLLAHHIYRTMADEIETLFGPN
jgi:hypothetical protein